MYSISALADFFSKDSASLNSVSTYTFKAADSSKHSEYQRQISDEIISRSKEKLQQISSNSEKSPQKVFKRKKSSVVSGLNKYNSYTFRKNARNYYDKNTDLNKTRSRYYQTNNSYKYNPSDNYDYYGSSRYKTYYPEYFNGNYYGNSYYNSRSDGDVFVKSYTKSNGTTVNEHYRSRPDGDKSNNFSTKGNINPYTGKKGYK